MLSSMPDMFIFDGISSIIVIIENNYSKHKDYGTNLAKINEKNNLNHTIGSIGINKLRILNSYIYTDINES